MMQGVHYLRKLGEKEARLGEDVHGSWHDEFKGSAYIFVGGLPFDVKDHIQHALQRFQYQQQRLMDSSAPPP